MRSSRTALVAWIVTLATIAMGCSVITAGSPGDVPCALGEDGADPCRDLGRSCIEGFCRVAEVCNGRDDDLDGQVDEDPESDVDRDGFTWCGGGTPELRDCDDNDPRVYPGAPVDLCDGRDNQCDGVDVDPIDAENCVAPQRCSRSLGACVDPLCTSPEFRCAEGFRCETEGEMRGECVVGDCRSTGCAAGQVCDPVTRGCLEPLPPGAPCTTDAQCADQVCMQTGPMLGLNVGLTPPRTPGICASACCDDRQCPPGQACWAPGTGARGCVDRAILSQGGLGEPSPEERTCSDRRACEPAQCLPGRYEAYDRARFGFVCAGMTNRADSPSCRSNDQCESGICLFGHRIRTLFGSILTGPCTAACRTGADCQRYEDAWNNSSDSVSSGDEITMGCLTVNFTDTTEWTQACFESTGAPAGAQCTTSSECLENACVGGSCRATCCSSADCPGSDICRPFVFGDHWQMRCAPPLAIL